MRIRPYQSVIPFILLLIISLLSIKCSNPPRKLVRAVHYGISLPYPIQSDSKTIIIQKNLQNTYLPENTGKRQPDVFEVNLILIIDSAGRVISYSKEEILGQRGGSDSLFDSHYRDQIKSLRFIPGTVDSVAAEVKIMVSAIIEGMGYPLVIKYPVEADMRVINNDLYWHSIELNSIELPAIEKFESYSFDIRQYDYHQIAYYKIYRIDLDPDGSVVSIDYHGGSYEPFTEQIRSAINWGRYSPLKIKGQAVPFSGFIVLLFYPGVENPTPVISPGQTDELSLLEKVRVRIYSDTIGLISKPVPVTAWTGDYSTKKYPSPLNEQEWSAWIGFDSLGVPKMKSLRYGRKQPRQAFLKLVSNERFYPAMDFSGHFTTYDGIAYIRFKSDTTIRIRFGWLPEPAQPHLP